MKQDAAPTLTCENENLQAVVGAVGYRSLPLGAVQCRSVHPSAPNLLLNLDRETGGSDRRAGSPSRGPALVWAPDDGLLGAGWFGRDYTEFGYEFGRPGERLPPLEGGVRRVRSRLDALVPPASRVPMLIGSGEKVTLRIVTQYADRWNDFGSAERFAEKNAVLDRWCAEQGCDPGEIERTTMIETAAADAADAYFKTGATHIVLGLNAPYDPEPLERLLACAKD
ncbi:hypothetical protein [Micromonospora sp. CPCC 205556]|uniref:hypothetical protein n=1 Tax=Micromonospora sp. CPCC 205556 TaxID=3122398 RepID=UPI002FF2E8F9